MGEWTLLGEALDYAVLGRTDGQVYIAPMALLTEEPRGSKILPVTHRTIRMPKLADAVIQPYVYWPEAVPANWEGVTYEIEDHEFLIASKLKIVVRATYAEEHDVWLLRGIQVSQKKEVSVSRYRVTHRVTKEAHEVEAPDATIACRLLGWMIGDCYVKRLSEDAQRRNARPEIRKAGGMYRE